MFPPAPEVSGGPTLQSFDVIEDPARMPGSRGGQACVNDTEAPPLQSSDAVVGSSTVQNGYMMNCLNHTLLCPGEVPRECMRQYDPVLCGIFFRSTPPPAAGGPRLNQTATALPLPPAAEPSSSDIDSGGSGGGDTLAIALGVSLGGAAALALAALGVVMWRRRDKGHKAAPADAAGKDAARLAAAAAAASATSSDPPTHAPAGKGEVFIEVREKDLSLAAGDNSDPLPSTTTIATPPLGLLALMGPGGGGGGGGLAQLRPWQVQDAGDQHLRVSAAETSASAQVNVLDGSGNGCGSGGGSGSGGSGGGGGIGAESDASAVLTLLPSVLGRGGAGSVLEGRYRGAPVAVKVLSWGTGAGGGAGADGATDEAPPPTLLAAFQAEVEALSRCQHPNIVSLLAVCTQPPRLCLVMERLDCSLDALIYQGAGVDRGLIPLPKVLHIAHQVCCGLAYLHPHTVHRDLSPANVLLRDPASPRPTVKLGDFGLARTQLSTRATRFPEVGSLGYIAPEAYDASNNVIRHYADVYALGVMLWAMLTGQVPWEGHSEVQVAVLVALQRKVPPLAPLLMRRDRCPPRLFELLAQCWDYEPERRPAAAELAKELLVLQELVERGLVGTGARGMSDDGSSHVPISNSGRTLMRARASFI
ncbi:hypothetical protein HYH03_002086 [Edaphochlamys debaryana]|uniref:Protein kinase domain-containing protein n=1 Tax=Edaphochlamys debaryana TaxID=47281 RepID=A0A835YLC4_9CHLO|nr:hypothetical protein HYH03_002086 [Edaphochlamys debaryana]|eukprot:KAG2499789.1 hypothetical protein HYH03_002086 [Edaphochlamys debaryana]